VRFGELAGQGWAPLGELALAFALSALIGLERDLLQVGRAANAARCKCGKNVKVNER